MKFFLYGELSDLRNYQDERHIHNERTSKKALWALSLALEYGKYLQSIDETFFDRDENRLKEWKRLVLLQNESKSYMFSVYNEYIKKTSRKLKNDLVAIASLPKQLEWLNDFDQIIDCEISNSKTPEKEDNPKQLKSYAEELEMILSFDDKEGTTESGVKGRNASSLQSKDPGKKKKDSQTQDDNESESSSEDEKLENCRSEKSISMNNRNNSTIQQSLKCNKKRSILSSDDDEDDNDADLKTRSRNLVKNCVGKQQQGSLETSHEKPIKTSMKESQSKEQYLPSAKESNQERKDGRKRLKPQKRRQNLLSNVSDVEKNDMEIEGSDTCPKWKRENFERGLTAQSNRDDLIKPLEDPEVVSENNKLSDLPDLGGPPTAEEDSNLEGNDDLLLAIMREMAVPVLMDGFESSDNKPEHESSCSPEPCTSEQNKPRNVEDDLALSSDDESEGLPSLHPRALTTQQSQEFRISDSVEEKMDRRDEALYCKTPLVLTQASEGFSVEELDYKENEMHDRSGVNDAEEHPNLKRIDTQSSIGFDTEGLIKKKSDGKLSSETNVLSTEDCNINTENVIPEDIEKDELCDEVEIEKDNKIKSDKLCDEVETEKNDRDTTLSKDSCDEVETEKSDRDTTLSKDSLQGHRASADRKCTEDNNTSTENIASEDVEKDQLCDKVETKNDDKLGDEIKTEKSDRYTALSKDSLQDHTANTDRKCAIDKASSENEQVNLSASTNTEVSSESEDMNVDEKLDKNRLGKEVKLESCNQSEQENVLKTNIENRDVNINAGGKKRKEVLDHQTNKSRVSFRTKRVVEGSVMVENRKENDNTGAEKLHAEELSGEEVHVETTGKAKHGNKNESDELMKNAGKEEQSERNKDENKNIELIGNAEKEDLIEGKKDKAVKVTKKIKVDNIGIGKTLMPEKTTQVACCVDEFSPPVQPSSSSVRKGDLLKRTQHISESGEIGSFCEDFRNTKKRSLFSSSEAGSTGNESEEDRLTVIKTESKTSISSIQRIKTEQQNGTTYEFQERIGVSSEHTESEKDLESAQDAKNSQRNGDHDTHVVPKTNVKLADSNKPTISNTKNDSSKCSTTDSKDGTIEELNENSSHSEKGSKNPEFSMVTRKRQEEASEFPAFSVSANTRGYAKRRPSIRASKDLLRSQEETDWRKNIDYIGVASEDEDSRENTKKRKITKENQRMKRRGTENSKLGSSNTGNKQYHHIKQIFHSQTGEAVGDAEIHEPSPATLRRSIVFNWGKMKPQPSQQMIKFSKNANLTKDGAGLCSDAKHSVFSIENRAVKEEAGVPTQNNQTTETSQEKDSTENHKPEVEHMGNTTSKIKTGCDDNKENRSLKKKAKYDEQEDISKKDGDRVVNCSSKVQETTKQGSIKTRGRLRRGVAATTDEDQSEIPSSEDSSMQDPQKKGRPHFTRSTRRGQNKDLSNPCRRLSSSSRSSISSFNLDTSISDEESLAESNNQMLITKRPLRRSSLFSTEESEADIPRNDFKLPSKRKRRKVLKKKLESKNNGNSSEATISKKNDEKHLKSDIVHTKKLVPEKKKDKDNKGVPPESIDKNRLADDLVLCGNNNVLKANTSTEKTKLSTAEETSSTRNKVKTNPVGTRKNTSHLKGNNDAFGVVSQLGVKATANKELSLKRSPKRGKSRKVICNRIESDSPSSEDSDGETNAERNASKKSCSKMANKDCTSHSLDRKNSTEELNMSESSEKISTDSQDESMSEKMSAKSATSDSSTSEGSCGKKLNGGTSSDDLHNSTFSSANADEEMNIVVEGGSNSDVPENLDQPVKKNIQDNGMLDGHDASSNEQESTKVSGRLSPKQNTSKEETSKALCADDDFSGESDLVIKTSDDEKEANKDVKSKLEKSAELGQDNVLSKSTSEVDGKGNARNMVGRLSGALAQVSRVSKPNMHKRPPPSQKTELTDIPASADYIENLFASMATRSQTSKILPGHDHNKDKQSVPFISGSFNPLSNSTKSLKSQTILTELPSSVNSPIQPQRSQTILIPLPSKEHNSSQVQRSQTKALESASKECNVSQTCKPAVQSLPPSKGNLLLQKSHRLSTLALEKNGVPHNEQTSKGSGVSTYRTDLVTTGNCSENTVTENVPLPSGKEPSKHIIPGVTEVEKEDTILPNSMSNQDLSSQIHFPEEQGLDKELFCEHLEDLMNCTVNSPTWTELIKKLCVLPTMKHLPQLIRALLICIMKEEPIVTHEAHIGLPSGLYKLFQAVKLFELRLPLPKNYLDDQILIGIHRFISKTHITIRPNSLACLVAWYTASCSLSQNWEKARVFLFEVLYFFPGICHQAILSALTTTRKLLIHKAKNRTMSGLEEVLHWIIYHGPWIGISRVRQNLITQYGKQTGLRKEPDKDPNSIATQILSALVKYEKKERSYNLISSLMLLSKWQGSHWVYKTLIPEIVAVTQKEKWQFEDEEYKHTERDEDFMLLLRTIFKVFPVQDHVEEISEMIPTNPVLHQSKLLKLVYGHLNEVVKETS
ncbi:uncharacterized protein LOC143025614 isoform X2 [Oratosquilla oratoria]|uniref:uncharacterized protein LOC143025614 isoform X2 n=1 Tax=Oratosquilla oratoria TaxID=337810 RepID=UPI003F777469